VNIVELQHPTIKKGKPVRKKYTGALPRKLVDVITELKT
jgi:hypothetical protein